MNFKEWLLNESKFPVLPNKIGQHYEYELQNFEPKLEEIIEKIKQKLNQEPTSFSELIYQFDTYELSNRKKYILKPIARIILTKEIHGEAQGGFEEDRNIVWVSRIIEPYQIKKVLLHELGHLFDPKMRVPEYMEKSRSKQQTNPESQLYKTALTEFDANSAALQFFIKEKIVNSEDKNQIINNLEEIIRKGTNIEDLSNFLDLPKELIVFIDNIKIKPSLHKRFISRMDNLLQSLKRQYINSSEISPAKEKIKQLSQEKMFSFLDDNFKEWLLNEAIINKEEFLKEIGSTENPHLYLQLSPDGKILMPDQAYKDVITIDKKYKSMIPVGSLQPLSKNFSNIINTIKKIYPEILNYAVSSTRVSGFRSPSEGYRTVQYWLDQQRTEPKVNLPKYFYHGTSTNLYNMFIKEQGLVPRQISGSSGSYGASSVKALSKGMFNYITIHPDYATREAAIQASTNHGGLPLIIKIDSTAIDPTKLYPDEDAGAETWEESIQKIGTVAYKGIIPKSSIVPYEISKDNHRLKWLPYEEIPTMNHPKYEKLIATKEHGNKDPIFFALYDKEVIDKKGNLLQPITSEEFNEIIKNAKWTTNAWLIYESMGDGALGNTRNYGMSKSNFDKEAQQIALDLYNNGILDNYLQMKSEYIYTHDAKLQTIIKYAKHLGKNSWEEIEQKLKSVYLRNNRDQNDWLYSPEAKKILGIEE